MWIYPKQLSIKLIKELKFIYILFGNDYCILEDCQFDIIKKAKKLNFNEHISIKLDINYDWNKIFNFYKTPDLLKQRRILSLKFSQDYPITHFNKNIPLLTSLLYEEILCILYIYTSNYIKKNNTCFSSLTEIGTFVLCNTPKHTQLIAWVMNQAENMQLSIEISACQLLCYYYEDNLILLKQMLQFFSLIYSDRNLSFIRVKNIIIDSTHFSINHWIEAILMGNKQRANRILRQLEYTEIAVATLLQKIQNEIYILINIKYNLIPKISLRTLLKKYKIYDEYRCTLLTQATRRLSINQLYKSLALLVQIELQYKKNHNFISKSNFELLATMLCSNNII